MYHLGYPTIRLRVTNMTLMKLVPVHFYPGRMLPYDWFVTMSMYGGMRFYDYTSWGIRKRMRVLLNSLNFIYFKTGLNTQVWALGSKFGILNGMVSKIIICIKDFCIMALKGIILMAVWRKNHKFGVEMKQKRSSGVLGVVANRSSCKYQPAVYRSYNE